MPARRFFVAGVRADGERVAIEGSDAHKVSRVLRLRDGDAIEIVDSAGTLYDGTLSHDGDRVFATLSSPRAAAHDAPALRIDVAQALPKGAKMDLIVEKCTELGAGAILPFVSERSIVRDAAASKVERWRRIAKTAAQQCGRPDVPEIAEVLPSLSALTERFGDYDVVLFPWELAPHAPLREALPPLLAPAARALAIIGPEGGFSHEEAAAAQAAGAHQLWLGPRILRTETAALFLLAAITALEE